MNLAKYTLPCLSLLLGALPVFSAAPSAPAPLVLANEGRSEYAIVVPDASDPRQRVDEAAVLLQGTLKRMSGVELPIRGESGHSGGPAIYLGATRRAKAAGIPLERLTEWTYCKRVVGKDLFLLGCDRSAGITGEMEFHDKQYLLWFEGFNQQETRAYREWRGTHKAVTSFLDHELGVRFLLPGPSGLHIPPRPTVTVPAALDFLGAPVFPYCNGRCYGDRTLTIALNHNDIPFAKNYGGHSYPVAVPAKVYGKTHPEYFVLVNGERRPFYGPGGAGHLCVSNPEVQELLMKELESQYAKGFRWVQLGQTDGLVPCECDQCRALGGGDTGELLWKVHRKIAEEMKRRLPDLKIVLLAYSHTARPPKSFDSFPDNVILELCIWRNHREFMQEWARFKDVPKIAYLYLWGTYSSCIFDPTRSVRYLADTLRVLRDNHVVSIYKCGFGTALGLEGPQYYVFSRLLEDPDQDPVKLLEEFCDAAYGKAAAPMRQFFTAVDARLSLRDGSSTLDVLETFPRNPRQLHQFTYPPSTVKFLANRLWYASTLDKDPQVQARIRLVRREFGLLQARTNLYALSDAWAVARTPAILAAYQREYDRAAKMVSDWYDDRGKMRREPGFDWPFLWDTPRNIVMFGGGSLNPSFPPELAQGFAPLKASLKMKLAPEDYVCLASQLRNPAQLETFRQKGADDKGAPSFGKDAMQTRFRIGYDQGNLYLAVTAASPQDPAAITPAGRDGDCRQGDSLAIYLDVEGTGKRCYRFEFNPVPNSCAEARKGYRDDPAHPDFGKEDLTWNGKWQYTVYYDAKAKVWKAFCTIPLGELGQRDGAYPGAQWRVNLVRRRPGGEVASWIELPNGVAPDAPANYGTLRFMGFRSVISP